MDLMVDGRWLFRNGEVTVFDEAAVIAEDERHAANLRMLSAEGRDALRETFEGYRDWTDKTFAGAACPHCGARHGRIKKAKTGGVIQ